MKQQDDGTVIQRFCIAILQKMSVKEESIPVYMKSGLIDWIIKLLLRSKSNDIHVFCLDFASALLANILHSNPMYKLNIHFIKNYNNYVSSAYITNVNVN